MTSTILRIDSCCRDKSLYPNSNDYRVPFKTTLWNVDSLEVVDAHIPMTEHAIPEGKNALSYSTGPDHRTMHKVMIPPGTYTPAELTTELNGATSGQIEWSYVASRGVMKCLAPQEVRIYITMSSGMSQILGAAPHGDVLTIPGGVEYEFENMVDTSGYTRYIVIRSDDIKDADSHPSIHPGLGTVFPPYVPGRNGEIVSPVTNTFVPHRERLVVGKSKMSSIGIRLERHDGEPFDTRGVDHVLIVRLWQNP